MIALLPLLLLAAAADVDEPPPSVDAWLSAAEGYRLRTSGEAFDHDASLFLDGGARGFSGRLGADLSGALFWDIDGPSRGFASLHDPKGAFDLLLDTAELRVSDDPLLTRLSLGRFTVDEGLPMTLDGVALAVSPLANSQLRWVLFASAGRTVHFYTFQDVAYEDWTVAAGSHLILPEGVKLELDYRALMEDSARQRMEHSWGAAFWRRIDDVFLGQLWARGLNAGLSHVGARAHAVTSAAAAPWQLGLDVDGVQQYALIGEIFEAANPLFAVLGPSQPHLRGSVDAFGRLELGVANAGLHLGAAGRRVMEGEPGPFNRDAGRVYAVLEAADIVVKGPFASVILSHDAAVRRAGTPAGDGSEDPAVTALGGSAGYRGDILRATVGTSFERTKYTYYRDVNELIDVRTVFASLDVRPLPALRVRAGYTLELADRVIHTVQLTLAEEMGGTW